MRTPLIRVAHVKFTPNGKAYPARCDRQDICEGHEVEVLMRADSEDAYFIDGVVDSISHHRWNCSCRVVNLTREVEYSISADWIVERKVTVTSAPVYSIADWRERKNRYYDSLPTSARDEMREIYNAVAADDGEDAYLSDGIWIKPDGTLEDRGR